MIRRWAVVSEKLSELIRLLDIEKVEENLFIANHPEGRTGRLYGGQIMTIMSVLAHQKLNMVLNRGVTGLI